MISHVIPRLIACAVCVLAWSAPAPASADQHTDAPLDAAALQAKCDAGDLQTCYDLALAYCTARGVPEDHSRCTSTFQRACDAGHLPSCDASASIALSEDGTDHAAAAALYQKVCDAGYGPSCKNLGVLYTKGDGVPKDRARALDMYSKGCDLNDGSSCDFRATAYKHGDPPDLERARALFKKACDLGILSACKQLQAANSDAGLDLSRP